MSEKSYYHGKSLELSTIGIATRKKDQYGPARQLLVPEMDWEKFGCEDPRVTKIDESYYIFYTAISKYPFEPDGIRVAVAITKDLENIESRHLVTPFNAKAMALFPEKINGKYTAILTVHSDLPPSKIAIIQFDKIEQIWSSDYWQNWYKEIEKHSFDLRRSDSDHAEVGAVPVKTKDGWLLIYSHIQNYFTDNKIFGIEALLLDNDNPLFIKKRTKFALMVPEQTYERYGKLPNIIFPSGAIINGDNLEIFYGACDTYCASASVKLEYLMSCLSADDNTIQYVKRYDKNPILSPIEEHSWEANYVLNPAAIELDDKVHILYRALGHDNTSVIGHAVSQNGFDVDSRDLNPIYTPREDFESKKAGPGTLSGCEDARIVKIEDKLYITYTAYNGIDPPRVATTSIAIEDFLKNNWQKWSQAKLISPDSVDDKDAAIFPEKINSQYMILHRVDRHICADFVSSLDFSNERLDRCIQMLGPRPGMWDHGKVGIAGPPFKTGKGWVLFYHGISNQNHYMLGAVLLDMDNPTKIIGRTAQPIMTPIESWEVTGWIPNVVFPCGQVARDGIIYLYYGGADKEIGVATLEEKKLLEYLM